jgi:hypothetical protein
MDSGMQGGRVDEVLDVAVESGRIGCGPRT